MNPHTIAKGQRYQTVNLGELVRVAGGPFNDHWVVIVEDTGEPELWPDYEIQRLTLIGDPSKTVEHPVEELIGWKWNEAYRFWMTGPYASDSRPRAEVDDLADWLRRSCESVEICWLWDDDCHVSPSTNGSWCITAVTARSGELVNAEADTIRDALIAAVRTVCDERRCRED